MADERGYFWYVLEAKCVEGSAVPIGSNTATPTLSISDKGTPSKDTSNKNEPDNSTQSINYKFLIENLKIN